VSQELEIEVFRSGDYGTKGAFDDEALNAIAADYDLQLHEAPVTLDHEQTGPAYGWVASVRRKGSYLVARLHSISSELIEFIQSGAYKKRSIELYRQFPETGRPYLRAVSFLGACPPEVKGLADPVFADGGPSETIVFDNTKLEEETEAAEEVELAEAREIFGDASDPAEAPPGFTPSVQPYLSLEKKVAEMRREKRLAAAESFCDAQRAEGRYLPAWDEMELPAFMASLAETSPVAFGEDGEEVSRLEWFKAFIESLPPFVPLGETVAGHGDVRNQVFHETLPRQMSGVRMSADSLAMHRGALRLMDEEPGLGYSEALAREAEANRWN